MLNWKYYGFNLAVLVSGRVKTLPEACSVTNIALKWHFLMNFGLSPHNNKYFVFRNFLWNIQVLYFILFSWINSNATDCKVKICDFLPFLTGSQL
jgi:hypothetical protein